MALQILIVVEEERRSAETVRAVTAAGCDIAAVISCNDDICTAVHRLRPDAVLISTASPDREWLARLRDVSPDDACPVVLCCDDDSDAAVVVAPPAGVNAYVIEALHPRRMKVIVQAAIARFRELRRLRHELAQTQVALTERKVLERAKGLIMKQHGVSEGEAYHALRRLAMSRNKRLIDVAEGVIAAVVLLLFCCLFSFSVFLWWLVGAAFWVAAARTKTSNHLADSGVLGRFFLKAPTNQWE